MFGGGEPSILLHAAHESSHVLSDTLRIFAERARIDNRIARIVIYVGNRRINPVNAHGASFQRGDFAHGVSVGWISSRSQTHRRGERCAFSEPHRRAAFEVSSNK